MYYHYYSYNLPKINTEYIIVVRENENTHLLEMVNMPIELRYQDMMERLREMAENPNRTRIDLQQYYLQTIDRYLPEYYNYCFNNLYSGSYTQVISCPTIMTFEDIKSLDRERTKTSFIDDVKRFLMAVRYDYTLQKIKNNPRNKMFSSAYIGFTNFHYKIDADLTFVVDLNSANAVFIN